MRRFLPALLLLASCGFDLVTPETGTCDASAESPNRWPFFEDGLPTGLPDEADLGFDPGDVPPDFRLVDQFGEEVCLWQFWGKVVVVDVSALWCGPCRKVAEHTACVQESFGDDLIYLTIIIEDQGYAAALPEHGQSWSDDYDLAQGTLTPVVVDGDRLFASLAWAPALPTFMLLDRDLSIVKFARGDDGDAEIRNELASMLGEPTDSCGAE